MCVTVLAPAGLPSGGLARVGSQQLNPSLSCLATHPAFRPVPALQENAGELVFAPALERAAFVLPAQTAGQATPGSGTTTTGRRLSQVHGTRTVGQLEEAGRIPPPLLRAALRHHLASALTQTDQ